MVALALPFALGASPASAQISPTTGAKGLGSLVNCSSGSCGITGGTEAGNNLFHRFDTFKTQGNNVLIKGYTNSITSVIMGVLNGTTIDRLVGLETKANLFWLSPGGISITGAGGFKNVGQVSLSTANKLSIGPGAGVFDVFETTIDQVAALTGAPGAFVSDPGGNVDIKLDLADGSVLEVDSSLLLDTRGGKVILNGPGEFQVGGDLEINGPFEWSGGATISGSGRLITNAETTLAGPEPLRIGKSWINDSNVLFTEAASVQFLRPARWDNAGVINLDGGAIDPAPIVSGPVLVFNIGAIEKTNVSPQRLGLLELQNLGEINLSAGSLFIDSPITLQNGNITLANNVKLLLRPNLIFNQGTIAGTGSIELGESGSGTLNNLGTITPGQVGSAGAITISGNFFQSGEGRLLLDIGGPNPGASDKLVVTGKADLPGGTLAASLIGGHVPTQGDSIELLRADAGLTIGPGLVQKLPPNVAPLTNDNSYSLVILAPPVPPDRPNPPPLPVQPPEPPVVVVPPEPPPITPPPITPPPITPPVVPDPPVVIPPVVTTPPPPRPAPPEEPDLFEPLLIDQKQFLLTALASPGLAGPSDSLAGLQLEIEDGSFSSSGETPASGAASGRGAGAPTALSVQQTRENFLQGESQAQVDTAAKLGLAGAAGSPAPTPERLQCLLREAADWVRSGQSSGQGRPEEEDPCRS